MLLCKSVIPSKPGAAVSWKPICQGSGLSKYTGFPEIILTNIKRIKLVVKNKFLIDE